MERAHARAWPDLEARLVVPGDEEVVGGRLVIVPPATDPHGHTHTRVAYVVRAHARAGWIVGTDRLMRLGEDSDFAPDVAVYQHRAGTQVLKDAPRLAFEVVGRRSMAASTKRARILRERGVERVFCVTADGKRVMVWDPAIDGWRALGRAELIRARCLIRPLPVAALIDDRVADDAVMAALRAKKRKPR